MDYWIISNMNIEHTKSCLLQNPSLFSPFFLLQFPQFFSFFSQNPLPIKQEELCEKIEAYGHHDTRRDPKNCVQKKLHNDLCSNQSLQKHFRGQSSCQFSAISAPNDPSPSDLKWGNTFISVKWKISKNYLSTKILFFLSCKCHLGILSYFWQGEGLTRPSKFC